MHYVKTVMKISLCVYQMGMKTREPGKFTVFTEVLWKKRASMTDEAGTKKDRG